MLLYPRLDSYKRMCLAIRTEMDITSFISTNVIISVISINVKIHRSPWLTLHPLWKSQWRGQTCLWCLESKSPFFLMIFPFFSPSIITFICSNLNFEIYFNFLTASTSASSLSSTSASASSAFVSASKRLHCSFSCPRWTWSLKPIIELRLRLMRNLFVVTRNC